LTPTLTAEVALHPITGTSVVDAEETITAANVGEHLPPDEVIADAARRLAEHGFDVEQAGPVTIRITGDPQRFEEVFPDGAIPDGLSDVVAAVTFPERPELFG
jgi:hypothetical protein